jgi:hypothetical protein
VLGRKTHAARAYRLCASHNELAQIKRNKLQSAAEGRSQAKTPYWHITVIIADADWSPVEHAFSSHPFKTLCVAVWPPANISGVRAGRQQTTAWRP